MTTLTRPTWLRPRDCTLALRKSGLQFVSPFNGTLQAVETLAERWTMQMTIPGASDGGARSAFFNQWAGGVNHVPLYHFGRPQPLGTLRGAPTLASATARGNTSLALAGCRGLNAVVGGSFEVDTNADGVADGWARYSNGTTGSLTAGLSTTAVAHGTYSQQVFAAGLGSADTDRNGVVQLGAPVSQLAGQAITLQASVAATTSTVLMLYAAFKDSGGTPTGGDVFAFITANGAVQTITASGTCPATAVTADVYVYQRNGSGGGAVLLVDAVVLVAGAAPASYPVPPTLLAGDMIGDGTQLYMVASDCTATDAGAMTVPVVNRARGVVASGTVVQWDRPTALFALPAMEQSTTWLRGGVVDSIALDAVEVY